MLLFVRKLCVTNKTSTTLTILNVLVRFRREVPATRRRRFIVLWPIKPSSGCQWQRSSKWQAYEQR